MQVLFSIISGQTLAVIGAISTAGAGIGLAFLTSRAKSVDVWKDVAAGRQEQVEDRDHKIGILTAEVARLTEANTRLESDVVDARERDQTAVLTVLANHTSILQRIAGALEGGGTR